MIFYNILLNEMESTLLELKSSTSLTTETTGLFVV